jgi:hypothetical protein
VWLSFPISISILSARFEIVLSHPPGQLIAMSRLWVRMQASKKNDALSCPQRRQRMGNAGVLFPRRSPQSCFTGGLARVRALLQETWWEDRGRA